MPPVAMVLFKDEAGNNVAAVEWDTDEWVVFCADEDCEWRYRDGDDLALSCAVASDHLVDHERAAV